MHYVAIAIWASNAVLVAVMTFCMVREMAGHG
jgi:hypothetical protein